jgi:hypothetical protein
VGYQIVDSVEVLPWSTHGLAAAPANSSRPPLSRPESKRCASASRVKGRLAGRWQSFLLRRPRDLDGSGCTRDTSRFAQARGHGLQGRHGHRRAFPRGEVLDCRTHEGLQIRIFRKLRQHARRRAQFCLVAGRRPRDNPSFTHRRSLRSRPVIFWTAPGMASLPASSTDLQRGTIHWPKACRSVLSSGAQGRLAGHPLSPSRSCVRAALPSSRAAGPRAPGAALLGSSCAGNPSSWAWASILSSSYLPRRAPHRCPPRRNVGALGGKLLSNAQASRPPPCSCEAF